MCWCAAARPRAVRAASFARRVDSLSGQALPPPTSTAARPSGPSGALHTSGTRSLIGGLVRRLVARPGPDAAHQHRVQARRRPVISHVIPLGLFQELNCDRWDCSVCGRSPKVTVGNYVRLLFSPGPAAAHRHCGIALPLCNPAPPISHVIPLRLFQTLNSGRWNCNVIGLC